MVASSLGMKIRALGLLYSGCRGLTGLECEDVTKCYFFENGWYQKVTHALSEWTNLSDSPTCSVYLLD